MDRGEIWLVSLDPIAGHEQSLKRPVLIVSPASLNKLTRLPVVVPVTSGGNFACTAGFTVSLDGAGTKTTGVIRCDQPRTMDMGARSGKRLERIPDAVVNEVLARLEAILS
ncbi:type II toxin-antitoxin system PemK/MazF family toxin [Raoultella ornithinolytica]|uniref:type II toxin-antitoxin system PemK/MazF family toxin n=1 Tax=Raoultella ornithinolytica TaxID=54291 RepID=UPI0010A32A97|nr:type II toxin-antitoxin system PemK/MazF family toxin [Raoultella ornithinolytica]MEB4600493.1 type II toxin-antitoxin system PemK/MazF family toxin [Raoultella ornithinolytica]MEB7944307.1 type II toxin-antitoxin system PemK/MazF family toxin [Raoultella ornithinolytica]THE40921.1 pemk protein [Raoultella ornithinolytica]